jgi:hypothetical protein
MEDGLDAGVAMPLVGSRPDGRTRSTGVLLEAFGCAAGRNFAAAGEILEARYPGLRSLPMGLVFEIWGLRPGAEEFSRALASSNLSLTLKSSTICKKIKWVSCLAVKMSKSLRSFKLRELYRITLAGAKNRVEALHYV